MHGYPWASKADDFKAVAWAIPATAYVQATAQLELDIETEIRTVCCVPLWETRVANGITTSGSHWIDAVGNCYDGVMAIRAWQQAWLPMRLGEDKYH